MNKLLSAPLVRIAFLYFSALFWLVGAAEAATATAAPGKKVTLSVTAGSGTSPFTYQWKKEGANIGGATASTYVIASVQVQDAGAYTVVVSNLAGSTTSDVGTLTVSTIPTITTQPVSQTIIAGNAVTFIGGASGIPVPTYQWQKDGVDINGATGSSYTIANSLLVDAGNYRLVASNSAGSVNSNVATLTVQTVPIITTQPVGQTIIAGNAVTFIGGASGSPVPTYQWQKDGVDINGATGSSYTIASSLLVDAGNYRLVASNAAGSVNSDVATLTVQTVPVIATQPALSQTVIYGNTVTFTVVATGFPAPTYQWRKNGVDIGGATSSSYTINAVQFSDMGMYSVVVTNAAGSAVSANAELVVVPNWKIAGTGDFNGDGKIDILWRKESTGAVALWLMDGTTILSTPTIGNIAAAWKIAGTGDFNGDGKIDILWRKESTGAVALWLMDGTTVLSTPTIGNIAAAWTIAGTGDFDGDGKIDILWRKESTGAVALWLMDGMTVLSTPIIANISAAWKIGGTGDFDGDGKIDILWRKESTGAVALWLMDGTTVLSTPNIANIAAAWKIAGTGDFDGDGKIDILWRKESTGAVALWLLDGTTVLSTPTIGTIY